jgi:hypothetical protein
MDDINDINDIYILIYDIMESTISRPSSHPMACPFGWSGSQQWNHQSKSLALEVHSGDPRDGKVITR